MDSVTFNFKYLRRFVPYNWIVFFFFFIIIVLHESFHTNQGVCFEKKIDSDNNANYFVKFCFSIAFLVLATLSLLITRNLIASNVAF